VADAMSDPFQRAGLSRYDALSEPRGPAIRRREFIKIVAVSAAAWPLVVRAQQSERMRRIGVLWHAGSAEEEAVFLRPLTEGIAKLGYVERAKRHLRASLPGGTAGAL
jgi:hypothetical protein